jgi:hypothetical protein
MIKQKPVQPNALARLSGLGAAAANRARQTFTVLRGHAGRLNAAVSSEKFLIPKPIVSFAAMFVFSFLVIALETIQFHLLLVVTNYLKATFVISIAMLGIAIGSLIGFYASKLKLQGVLAVSACLLFFSVILSYYNIINIGALGTPWLLILPFIFASVIVSSIFMHGNSNTVYFVNLIASASGVLYPVIFLPILKSETSLMLLLTLPAAFVFLQAFRIRNIPVKILVAGLSCGLVVLLAFGIVFNVNTPDTIRAEIFETKIISEFDQDPGRMNFEKNIPLEFFTRAYRYDRIKDTYLFTGDEYDFSRAHYLLQVTGFMSRWGIGQIPFLENRTIVDDHRSLSKSFFENELVPLLKKKNTT